MSKSRWLAAGLSALVLAAAAGPAGIEVNRASESELEALRGVGPDLSARILAARQQGPFRDWADLIARVAGIGAASAARLSQAGLTVAGARYDAAAAPPAPAHAGASAAP